ncbi:hypothetical protein LIER_19757 [Lithospermum erythrorhizon]|uniref:MULE transposase domain-containing protein n=1 Tax=Lithospermum erythrorhizon TaxID=34254 RepID=A0AAV3QN75_LITER
MSSFIRDHEHEAHKDANYMALYREERNLYSVRVHYNGRFVGSIESWAFRLGFRYDEFKACVYQDPEIEGHNGIRCLKYAHNVTKFLSLAPEYKFMDVYFLRSSNSQLIDEVDDGNLSLSVKDNRVSNEVLKSKSVESAKLVVIPFNLGDDNDVVHVNGIENETTDMNGVENESEKGKEKVNEVENEVEHDVDNEVKNEDFRMDYDSEDSVDYSEESGSESESDGSGDDDDLNSENVLYGKEMDGFDDGELAGSQPTLSAVFLENIEEEFVIPDHDGHAENDVDAPIDNNDSDVPNGAAAVNKKKGSQMSTFEKSVFDGTLNEGQTSGNKKKRYRGPYARHGIEFKHRRLSGWVQTDKGSDGEQDEEEEDDNSDLNSGDSTSDSDGIVDINKLRMTCRRKRRYVHFNGRNMRNPKLFPGLVFSSSEQFKEVMKWYALIRRKDVWLTCNESKRLGARYQYGLVWDYVDELKRTHQGSTVFVEYDESEEDGTLGVFKRIYVCLKPLIDGFKAGCRKLIGLDGCHTKGVHKQQILTAIALDPNNGWWPLCWAVVEKENKDVWKWFIQALSEVLNIVDQEDYVIMSDR